MHHGTSSIGPRLRRACCSWLGGHQRLRCKALQGGRPELLSLNEPVKAVQVAVCCRCGDMGRCCKARMHAAAVACCCILHTTWRSALVRSLLSVGCKHRSLLRAFTGGRLLLHLSAGRRRPDLCLSMQSGNQAVRLQAKPCTQLLRQTDQCVCVSWLGCLLCAVDG